MTYGDQPLEITRESPDTWWRATRDICSAEERPVVAPAVFGEPEHVLWLTAKRRGQIVGTCWGESAPGRTATVFPPTLARLEPFTTGRVLLQSVADHFRTRHGVRLVYVLLPPERSSQEFLLESAGFQRLGTTLHMVGPAANPREDGRIFTASEMDCPCDRSIPSDRESLLEFEPCDASTEGMSRLARTFAQTCDQTLDFPELHRWLDAEQSLDGYRQVGHFRPDLWHIIRLGGNDVGCLLLNELDEPGAVQLTYLGLIPAVRGVGRCRDAVRFGRMLAGQRGARHLMLTVDQRNTPAVNCYRAAGFAVRDRHTLFAKPVADDLMDEPG